MENATHFFNLPKDVQRLIFSKYLGKIEKFTMSMTSKDFRDQIFNYDIPDILSEICQNGYLNILQRFNPDIFNYKKESMSESMEGAALNGHIDIIKFLIEKQWKPDVHTIKATITGDHLEIFKILKCHWIPKPGDSKKIFEYLSKFDRIDFLEYLKENIEFDILCQDLKHTFVRAIEWGRIKTVKWLIENKVQLPNSAGLSAARKGWFTLFKILNSNGVKLCPGTFRASCYGGNLELIKFHLEEDVRTHYLDELRTYPQKALGICYAVAMGGHLEALKLVRSEGWPWDLEIYNRCRKNKDQMIDWIRKNGGP